MNTQKGRRGDRMERVMRGLLGLALVAAVVWAWVNGGPANPAGLARVWKP
jgi:hypothetical protein